MKKSVVIVLVGVLIAVGAVYAYSTHRAVQVAQAPAMVPTDRSVTQLPDGQISPQFPPDIPREKGAVVLESSEARHATEKTINGTYRFSSKADVTDNYIVYRGYFEKNHWKQLTKAEPSEVSGFLLYGVDRIQIAVSISKNATSTGSTVVLSVVTR